MTANSSITTNGGGGTGAISGPITEPGGNLVLADTLNVSGIGDSANASDFTTWRLFNYSGSLTNNGLTLGAMPSAGSAGKSFQIDTATAGQVNLVIVSEPGALALAGAGIATAGWLACKRQRSLRR